MNYCTSCGIDIPDGQNSCSMCYGDPGHGSDGYYQSWIDEQMQREIGEQMQREIDDRTYEDDRSI